jgi:hypothetical protein
MIIKASVTIGGVRTNPAGVETKSKICVIIELHPFAKLPGPNSWGVLLFVRLSVPANYRNLSGIQFGVDPNGGNPQRVF